MTSDEFKYGFDKLVSAFHVQKPTEKANVYFEYLENIDASVFSQAVNELLKESDKMPTIAKIIQKCAAIRPSYGRTEAKCNDCDGFGMVSKWRHSFRGRCIHGEQVSKQMALVPVTPEEKKRWYGRLNKEWFELYGEDLVPGKSYRGESIDPIVQKTKDMFGVI